MITVDLFILRTILEIFWKEKILKQRKETNGVVYIL